LSQGSSLKDINAYNQVAEDMKNFFCYFSPSTFLWWGPYKNQGTSFKQTGIYLSQGTCQISRHLYDERFIRTLSQNSPIWPLS